MTKRKSKAESSPFALHFRQVRPRQHLLLIDPLESVKADLLAACASSLLGSGHHGCFQRGVFQPPKPGQNQATQKANHTSAANLLPEHTLNSEESIMDCDCIAFMFNQATPGRVKTFCGVATGFQG
jgi:hypothetical protein